MNDNAKKWVAALRSGKYQQCQNALCREIDGQYTFCCLGVACDLFQKENSSLEITTGPDDSIAYDKTISYLPIEVKAWLNIKSNCGGYMNMSYTLAHDNDHGQSFNEIADIIEENEKELFIEE